MQYVEAGPLEIVLVIRPRSSIPTPFQQLIIIRKNTLYNVQIQITGASLYSIVLIHAGLLLQYHQPCLQEVRFYINICMESLHWCGKSGLSKQGNGMKTLLLSHITLCLQHPSHKSLPASSFAISNPCRILTEQQLLLLSEQDFW